MLLLLHEGGDRSHLLRCCRSVFSSSTVPTLMGRFGQNGLVHVLFRQWELSLEGLTKAWSGLESTVRWVMELGTTGHMCQSKQFVPACLLLCQPFSPETCHSSLYNQSFPLYNQLCSYSIIRTLWHLLDKAYLLRVHACKFRWPEAVCVPHYMNGDMSVSW